MKQLFGGHGSSWPKTPQRFFTSWLFFFFFWIIFPLLNSTLKCSHMKYKVSICQLPCFLTRQHDTTTLLKKKKKDPKKRVVQQSDDGKKGKWKLSCKQLACHQGPPALRSQPLTAELHQGPNVNVTVASSSVFVFKKKKIILPCQDSFSVHKPLNKKN